MREPSHWLARRTSALRYRIEELANLRRLVNLAPEQDITERQWSALEPRLAATSVQLLERVKRASNDLLPGSAGTKVHHALVDALGRIEFDLAKAYAFFDTYMDVLTQRRAPRLGSQLAGCDVLAGEAMRRPNHPALALIEPPLVYCDRGFGASIIRESVMLPDGSPNPIPLIQIPYSRLREKYNLTSVLHEAGHQALQRLGLVSPLADAVFAAVGRTDAGPAVAALYRLWASEIGPDFWAFCLCGAAEAGAVRDLFALPLASATRISYSDPHPPPYLRALLAFEWCRRAWGRGIWDEWERDWRDSYALRRLPADARSLLLQAHRAVPVVSAALFEERFAQLNGRRLPDLFDLDAIAPSRIGQIAASARSGALNLRGLRPCAQLAVFGDLRARYRISEERLDRLMSQWLRRLGATRQTAR